MFSGFRTHMAVAAAIFLVGCTNAAPPAGQQPAPVDCGASALQDQTGKPVTGSSAADVKIGGKSVQSRGLVRIFVTGQPVTQDYRAERLNLETNVAGNLVQATCG